MVIDPAESLVHVQAMSLATRCTFCGTVFRVVQDQLKVSEGWVRCGRCDNVFNALETLFDLEREAPPEWIPVASQDVPISAATSIVAAAEPGAFTSSVGLETQGSAGLGLSKPAPDSHAPDAQQPTHEVDDAFGFAGSVAEADFSSAAHTEHSADSTPAFMRGATRPSHRQSAKSRIKLSATAFALACGLAGQLAHHFRDLVATRIPVTRPALMAWCTFSGCAIDAVRRIEDVAVETSALTRAPALDGFRLSVTLRNRGSMVVALPSIELSLTNTAGAVLARRTFGARDFLGISPRMQVGSESVLQVTLATGMPNISGYTVEIFYP